MQDATQNRSSIDGADVVLASHRVRATYCHGAAAKTLASDVVKRLLRRSEARFHLLFGDPLSNL